MCVKALLKFFRNCVSVLLHILLKGESCQAYNIAAENSNITIRELAEIIAKIGEERGFVDIPSEIEKAVVNKVSKSVFSTEKFLKRMDSSKNIQ